jgi:hypothetical protein
MQPRVQICWAVSRLLLEPDGTDIWLHGTAVMLVTSTGQFISPGSIPSFDRLALRLPTVPNPSVRRYRKHVVARAYASSGDKHATQTYTSRQHKQTQKGRTGSYPRALSGRVWPACHRAWSRHGQGDITCSLPLARGDARSHPLSHSLTTEDAVAGAYMWPTAS